MARTKKNDDNLTIKLGETIIDRSMDDVMHNSMMPYAEHVILERALPRVEDGLKPVQRRILYTMLELGVTPDKPYRKSARIVGDALGKYHPHGDTSVYDAMVRLAQDFNMRMPLVDGHGNFGSIDGDSPAAMRYTEVRMTPLALELLRDLDKDTVKFSLNFDDTLKEPDVLPGRFPNLLVNGTTGIAVGLATNIPPHNLKEAISAVVAQIDNPDITLDELMEHIPAPDFPTGGYLINSPEIRNAYETGKGKLTMRAKTHIEDGKGGKKLIVITEFPYQVNKAKALEDILKLSQEKKVMFAGIADIRDESDRMGIRAVIEVKKDADAEKILQYLFKYSDLQCTFGVNMVAIANGKPEQMGLKKIIEYYIKHQENVVTRRTKFDLENALKREHILEGLMIAVLNIDEVIAIIRASKSPKIAKENLIERFELSDIQAQAILDLRLQRLTNLETIAIEKEYKDIKKLIKELRGILASESKLKSVIKKEITEIMELYSSPRLTEVIDGETNIEIKVEDTKVIEKVSIMILDGGKIRRITQKIANEPQIVLPEGERIIYNLNTSTDKRIKLFTNKGSMVNIDVEDIQETKLNARAVNINSLVELDEGEKIIAAYDDLNSVGGNKIYIYTKKGMVKCSEISQYELRTKKTTSITLKDDDEVIGIEGEKFESVMLVTKKGMSIRFERESIPVTGRTASGVKCMKLDEDDEIIFAQQVNDEGEILVMTDKGYAKRSFVFDYELQGRNGKGVKTFDFKKNGSNGTVIAFAMYIKESIDITVEQVHGTKTVISSEEIMIEQRAGKGRMTIMTILDDVVVKGYPVK